MEMKNPWHEVEIGEKSPEIINAIIEIPKDSQLKYEFDKKTGLLRLDRFLYSAVHYPGDYGFIPQTLWEDNDPLDVIILTGRPVYPMTLAKIRVIGVLRMIDSDEKDDKIIAVYDRDPRFKEFQDIKDIPTHTIEELRHFFETYKALQGKNTLAEQARARLAELGYDNVEVVTGDGFAGVPEKAPYDRIIVTAAAEEVPQALLDQLADNGVMILPVGPHDGAQHIIKLTKSQTGTSRENLIAVRFVPLLPGQAREL